MEPLPPRGFLRPPGVCSRRNTSVQCLLNSAAMQEGLVRALHQNLHADFLFHWRSAKLTPSDMAYCGLGVSCIPAYQNTASHATIFKLAACSPAAGLALRTMRRHQASLYYHGL